MDEVNNDNDKYCVKPGHKKQFFQNLESVILYQENPGIRDMAMRM